jgi:1,4-dihydroxy-2-naphthoyl-CoA synthase
MGYEYLDVADEENGLRVLTLNRPERMNSWHAPMRQELRDAVDQAAVDPGLRVLVVTGAGGKAFSAGEDVSGMADLTAIGTRGFRAQARRIHEVFDTIEAIKVDGAVGHHPAGDGRIVVEDVHAPKSVTAARTASSTCCSLPKSAA